MRGSSSVYAGFPVKRTAGSAVSGVLLFALCGVVLFSSLVALLRGRHSETSVLGMTITVLALVIMPVIAGIKRRSARKTNNQAMAADAVQSATCAYLAGLTLVSLAGNALFRIGWIDSLGALLAVPILIVEGRRAWRGQSCGCA